MNLKKFYNGDIIMKNNFKIGDKVKLIHHNYILSFDEYYDEWQKFWYDNENTIFIISSIIKSKYTLKYLNDKIVMNQIISINCDTVAMFINDELELYISNPLSDELFEL